MSKTYRQTISDELAAKVEDTRAQLGLSVQELTTIALALFCQQHGIVTPADKPSTPKQEFELTW